MCRLLLSSASILLPILIRCLHCHSRPAFSCPAHPQAAQTCLLWTCEACLLHLQQLLPLPPSHSGSWAPSLHAMPFLQRCVVFACSKAQQIAMQRVTCVYIFIATSATHLFWPISLVTNQQRRFLCALQQQGVSLLGIHNICKQSHGSELDPSMGMLLAFGGYNGECEKHMNLLYKLRLEYLMRVSCMHSPPTRHLSLYNPVLHT